MHLKHPFVLGTKAIAPMRKKILADVRANKPAPLPQPQLPTARLVELDAEARLAENAAKSKSKVLRLAVDDSLGQVISTLYPKEQSIGVGEEMSELSDATTKRITAETSVAELADVHLAVLRAELAVIENGACWVSESAMGHRGLPFACEHLALLVPRRQLVETMHEAYAQVTPNRQNFGVFIAGPSKTADIEQSLVIGAQGPRSLTIILTE